MTLHELLYEIKSVRDRLNTREVYTLLLIVVVGLGSFGLGRLSKLEETRSPIRIEQTLSHQTASALSAQKAGAVWVLTPSSSPMAESRGGPARATEVVQSGGQLVASKGGAKYHFPWCSGAQRIAEANKLWFNSVEEARNAGYTPASNCKGLK